MTYIEKLMAAVKYDSELITEDEFELAMRGAIEMGIMNNSYVWDYGLLGRSEKYHPCPGEVSCRDCIDCWSREMSE